MNLIRNNKLLYTFDDEVVSKFVYAIDEKKIELSFDGFYDLEKDEEINRKCILIIESWSKALSRLYPNSKFDDLESNFGIISMIVAVNVEHDEVYMTVSTIDNRHYDLIFLKPSMYISLV
ncbi:hypothetical protein [Myroides odoratimimus]|uniref:hypothetical protein n=1 Tax=Myroides odoratimimus TaxID=76832 RepID=UPI003100AB6A